MQLKCKANRKTSWLWIQLDIGHVWRPTSSAASCSKITCRIRVSSQQISSPVTVFLVVMFFILLFFFFSQASSSLRPPLARPSASSPAPSCCASTSTLTSYPKVRGVAALKGSDHRWPAASRLRLTGVHFEELFQEEGEGFLCAPVTDWGFILVGLSVKNFTSESKRQECVSLWVMISSNIRLPLLWLHIFKAFRNHFLTLEGKINRKKTHVSNKAARMWTSLESSQLPSYSLSLCLNHLIRLTTGVKQSLLVMTNHLSALWKRANDSTKTISGP